MPVTERMAHEQVPVILREIADGLQRSFGTETKTLDRFMIVQDTIDKEQEEVLLRQRGSELGEDDDTEKTVTQLQASPLRAPEWGPK